LFFQIATAHKILYSPASLLSLQSRARSLNTKSLRRLPHPKPSLSLSFSLPPLFVLSQLCQENFPLSPRYHQPWFQIEARYLSLKITKYGFA
jgi:hypothetical protein